jgi:benzodiazapine receptor
MKNWLKLIVSIVLAGLAGFIGSFFTTSSVMSWYPTLIKPSFNPPSWLFGPVWTILYIMIGVSLYLVWTSKAKKKIKQKAYIIFGVQLILNSLWSIVFFGMQQPAGAFLVIALLWISIIYNALVFYRISKPAGYLLVPYFLWVSFASVLNFAIWMLN